jgi:hypothetical protein
MWKVNAMIGYLTANSSKKTDDIINHEKSVSFTSIRNLSF